MLKSAKFRAPHHFGASRAGPILPNLACTITYRPFVAEDQCNNQATDLFASPPITLSNMNILTILLLSSAAVIGHAKENNHNLRGDNTNNFYPAADDTMMMTLERELSDTCVSRSNYLGCYEDRNNDRALSYEIDGRSHTAKDCEKACADKGFLYFAREWRGQVCSIYNNMIVCVLHSSSCDELRFFFVKDSF